MDVTARITLKGYDGKTHPFVALMFNPEFQEHYRGWWKALLLTADAAGKRLVDDPAVFGLEIQNEDSFFFWTFDANRIPDAQLRILETQFGEWLKRRHGSFEAAVAKWNGQKTKRDDVFEASALHGSLQQLCANRSNSPRHATRAVVAVVRHTGGNWFQPNQ